MHAADALLQQAKHAELITATESMLLQYDCKDLLVYCPQGQELVTQLYTSRAAAALAAKSDWLHELVSQISRRHGIDLSTLRRDLVARWLREPTQDGDQAARIAYLMTSGDIPAPAERLLARAMGTVLL